MRTATVLLGSVILSSCESEQVDTEPEPVLVQEELKTTSGSTSDFDMLSYCAIVPGATGPTTRTPELDGICRQPKGRKRNPIVIPPPLYLDSVSVSAIGSLGRATNGDILRPEHAAVADLNGDGLDDVVLHLVRDEDGLSAPPGITATPVVILLNNGAGQLVPGSSIPAPLNGVPGATPIIDGAAPSFFWARQILIDDFNQDGQPDIFFETTGLEPQGNPDLFPGEQNGLWLSSPNGKLVDVSATHLPQFSGFTHGSAVADVDGDTDLDIWVNNLGAPAVPPYLMLNDGTGFFTAVADLGLGDENDVGPNVGLNGRLPEAIHNGGFPFWSGFVDVDGDGDEDLYLGFMGIDAGATVDNRAVLLLNDSTGVFSLSPANAAPEPLWNSMGLVEDQAEYDINSDGSHDLVLTVTDSGPSPVGQEIQFLINTGAGGFVDETATRFPPQPDQEFHVETWFADLDGDGDDDLLTGTFAQREMYENDSLGNFTLVDPTLFEFDWWFLPLDIDGDGQGVDFLHLQGNPALEFEFYVTKRNP